MRRRRDSTQQGSVVLLVKIGILIGLLFSFIYIGCGGGGGCEGGGCEGGGCEAGACDEGGICDPTVWHVEWVCGHLNTEEVTRVPCGTGEGEACTESQARAIASGNPPGEDCTITNISGGGCEECTE